MFPLPQLDFRRTPVTLTLAAVAVALEIVCSLDDLTGDPSRRVDLYNTFFGILPYIWHGDIWRPFTTALMHGSLFHALFDVYWLVRFGGPLEERFGPGRYLGLVVLLGYVSILPQFALSPFVLVNYVGWLPQAIVERLLPDAGQPEMIVGLSGIVYGLFGLLLIGRRRWPELMIVCDPQTSQFLLFWLVLCIGLTHLDLWPVANTAHVAGLAFGLLYGQAIFPASGRGPWIAGSVAATLVVLAIMIP